MECPSGRNAKNSHFFLRLRGLYHFLRKKLNMSAHDSYSADKKADRRGKCSLSASVTVPGNFKGTVLRF